MTKEMQEILDAIENAIALEIGYEVGGGYGTENELLIFTPAECSENYRVTVTKTAK